MSPNAPEPPYVAVIFSAQRRAGDDEAYAEAARRMVELSARQPGFLGIESARGADGFGITVSYWRDESSARDWKREAEHLDAQRRGRALWYSRYAVRVARVERAYGMDAAIDGSDGTPR